MIVLTPRRLISLSVLALTVLTTATSCSSVTKDAARFNGESLSNSEFDDLLLGYATAVPEAFLTSGNLDISVAQAIVQNWISTKAVIAALDKAGISITDEDRNAALTALQAEAGFNDAPQVVQDFYVLASASQSVANREFEVNTDDLKALYEDRATQSGAVQHKKKLTRLRPELMQVKISQQSPKKYRLILRQRTVVLCKTELQEVDASSKPRLKVKSLPNS
jgi:hypothetical protein